VKDKIGGYLLLSSGSDGGTASEARLTSTRVVCNNTLQMAFADSKASVRVTHRGNDVVERVVQGTHEILARGERVQDAVARMVHTPLVQAEQVAFAAAATTLRWDDGEAPITPEQLLVVRRAADNNNTLWATFNRVQENMVRGGLRAYTTNGRRTRTRAIKSISEDTRVNKALWALAEKMLPRWILKKEESKP
jgi:hypothetical protein